MSIGIFSLSLKALAAQLDSLMDESGGEEAIALLDELSKLESPERNALLRAFITVAQEFVAARTTWNLNDIGGFTDFNGSEASNLTPNELNALAVFKSDKRASRSTTAKRLTRFERRSSDDIASKLCDEILRELMPEGGNKRSGLHVVPGGKGKRKIVKLKPHKNHFPPTPPIKPVA